MYNQHSGRVAQLGERSVRNGEAAGSIPATSTIRNSQIQNELL